MRVLYLILLLGCWLFYVLYQDTLSLLTLVAVMIFPLISLIMLLITAFSAKPGAVCENRSGVCEKGSIIRFRVWVKNPSFLPAQSVTLNFSVKNSFGGGEKRLSAVIALPAFGSGGASAAVRSAHCGNIIFTPEYAVFHDLFRLFKIKRRLGKSVSICVLPKLSPANEFLENQAECLSDSAELSVSVSGDDPSEIFDIREYRDGDPQNRILHRLSARYENLLVRELSQPVDKRVSVCADCFFSGNTDEQLAECDRMLCALCSASAAFLEDGTSFALHFSEGNSCLVTDEDSWFSALSELYSEIGKPRADSFAELLSEIPADCPLCAVTASEDGERISRTAAALGDRTGGCFLILASQSAAESVEIPENTEIIVISEEVHEK
ncbi:MAG: DUF58 domain-containing protein [Oscillospiraceae bacterium]|nr:DUF58 domain-containing protein [Oscillospiraceae bacterium]